MIIDIDSIYSFHQLGNRENQEDSRYPNFDHPSNDNAAFAVCDGVGGCDKGEVASSTVCNRIGEILSTHKNTDSFDDNNFQHVLNHAYKSLDKVSDSSNKGMGTTLTFLAFHSRGAMAAHIGDSRIYQIRPGEGIIFRSEDHSLVNALLRSGNISPDSIKDHPKGNVITRCMSAQDGVRERDDASVVNLKDIAPGDYFLLCTDGVTGKVDEEELIELYNSDKTDEDKCKYLAAKCIDSADNNTAIQIHVGLVTIEPQEDSEDELFVEGQEIVKTAKIETKEDSVHDLSPLSEKTQSKLKSFFNRLFK
ncbi:MAG: protein phosphatase 2C domain-containing protein [Muribaculaceae bacterium]|nr:protein phosphatase 2C domain-containing protein [Muribaculaceae bacterium]